MEYDAKIWGPHYWFFLHTLAFTYPTYPNDVVKKKYYDTIQNFPFFIPHDPISKYFTELLTIYPIKSYLDNKASLIRWVHFIHNKINTKLEKPQLSLEDFYVKYYKQYKPKTQYRRVKYLGSIVIILCAILCYFLYKK